MTHLRSASAQANPSHACFAARPTAALQTCVCSGGTSRSGIARRDRSVAWREETLGIVGSTPPPADASRTDGKSVAPTVADPRVDELPEFRGRALEPRGAV